MDWSNALDWANTMNQLTLFGIAPMGFTVAKLQANAENNEESNYKKWMRVVITITSDQAL